MQEYTATSINENENRFRDYSMEINQTLFGDYVLTCSWGRIGQKKRKQNIFFKSYNEALKEFKRIKKIRKTHKYNE